MPEEVSENKDTIQTERDHIIISETLKDVVRRDRNSKDKRYLRE